MTGCDYRALDIPPEAIFDHVEGEANTFPALFANSASELMLTWEYFLDVKNSLMALISLAVSLQGDICGQLDWFASQCSSGGGYSQRIFGHNLSPDDNHT